MCSLFVDSNDKFVSVLHPAEMIEAEPDPQPPEWSLKEKLGLIRGIRQYGHEDNWAGVAAYTTELVEYGRPNDWTSESNCILQFSRLLESADKEEPEQTICDTVLALETKFRDERVRELYAEIEEDNLLKAKLEEELRVLESGEMDDRLDEVAENDSFYQEFMAFKAHLAALGLPDEEDEIVPMEIDTSADSEVLQIDTKSTPNPIILAPPKCPSSPKVSPQLKNLVYSAIAGTQEDAGRLPTPASSPTLSMLLEMPPRGHGQPLPEINMVKSMEQLIRTLPIIPAEVKKSPHSDADALPFQSGSMAPPPLILTPAPPSASPGTDKPIQKPEKSLQKPLVVQEPVVVILPEVDIKTEEIKSEVPISTSKPAEPIKSPPKSEQLIAELISDSLEGLGNKSSEIDPLIVTIDLSESPCTSPSKIPMQDESIITLDTIPGIISTITSPSDTETTISGSASPNSQFVISPGNDLALNLRSRRLAAAADLVEVQSLARQGKVRDVVLISEVREKEDTSLKSLRGRVITPVKDKCKDNFLLAVKDKDNLSKVRVKLEFEEPVQKGQGSPKVDFKTVQMKESEQQQQQQQSSAVQNLRSRRGPFTPTIVTKVNPFKVKSARKDEETPAKSVDKIEKKPDNKSSDKKPGLDAYNFHDSDGELSDELYFDDNAEGSDSVAQATERWVHGAKKTGSGLNIGVSKPRIEPMDEENLSSVQDVPVLVTPKLIGRPPKKHDRTSEKSDKPPKSAKLGDSESGEKEGDEKRITRARTKTTPFQVPIQSVQGQSVSRLSTSAQLSTPSQAQVQSQEVQSDSDSLSRSLRSRARLRDTSFSSHLADPASPRLMDYSGPHSPASSTATNPQTEDEKEDKNMKRSLLSLHKLVTTIKTSYIYMKLTLHKQSKPTYLETVFRLLDLSTIKKNIDKDSIKSFEDYQVQVSIMFLNHLMYFNEAQEVAMVTREMAKETFDIIEDFIQNYNESNSKLWTGSGSEKRESRARDLRLGRKFQSTTPSVSDQPSGSEESHDEGKVRRKRSELSPNITDVLLPRVRPPLPPPGPSKARHSAV